MNYDLVVTNARIVDVSANTVYPGEVLIRGGLIAEVGKNGKAGRKRPKSEVVIDAEGCYVAPGLMDGHIHIESSMLAPIEFAKHASLHGTTAVFVDPHEIANVLGKKGIRLFLEQAKTLPLDMYVGIPSCVPATHLETSGASISAKVIESMINDPRVYGLAEMMNFPGIIHGFGDARTKVQIALRAKKIVDGHCPGLSGKDLKTYIANGRSDGRVRIMSDHEATTAKEALEKHRAGMFIHIRYGSASKDLDRILPELIRKKVKLDRFGLACDDLDAGELFERGHMDRAVKRARNIIQRNSKLNLEGATIQALAMATLNPANYFSRFFKKHCLPIPGLIAKGRKANLVIFNSLHDLKVSHVIHAGKVVVKDGRLVFKSPKVNYAPWTDTMHLKKEFKAEDFRIPYTGQMSKVPARVIGVTKNSILTDNLILPIKVKKGRAGPELSPDPARDIIKIAVIERHRGSGACTVGLVKGLGIKRGAVACTVAHDSHNLILAGADDESMANAANFLARTGGGMAVVHGKNTTYLPLRIAGLMSTLRIESVIQDFKRVKQASHRLGTRIENIFIVLSFLALPVIPSLKITDQGLVDVNKFEFTSVLAE